MWKFYLIQITSAFGFKKKKKKKKKKKSNKKKKKDFKQSKTKRLKCNGLRKEKINH